MPRIKGNDLTRIYLAINLLHNMPYAIKIIDADDPVSLELVECLIKIIGRESSVWERDDYEFRKLIEAIQETSKYVKSCLNGKNTRFDQVLSRLDRMTDELSAVAQDTAPAPGKAPMMRKERGEPPRGQYNMEPRKPVGPDEAPGMGGEQKRAAAMPSTAGNVTKTGGKIAVELETMAKKELELLQDPDFQRLLRQSNVQDPLSVLVMRLAAKMQASPKKREFLTALGEIQSNLFASHGKKRPPGSILSPVEDVLSRVAVSLISRRRFMGLLTGLWPPLK